MMSSSRSDYLVFKAVFSHYWRHPWQTLFLISGLIAGVGLWSAVEIINSHAEASYKQADSMLGAQVHYQVRSKARLGIPQAVYIQLRRAGFRQVFPVLEAEVSTKQGDPVSIVATDLFAIPAYGFDQNDTDKSSGRDIGQGGLNWIKFIQPPYQTWVPAALAKDLGLHQGDSLLLRDGRKLAPAVIQNHSQQGRRVLMDPGAAFRLTGRRNFSYLAVGKIGAVQLARLESSLPDEFELVENQQYLDLTQLTKSLHTHLTAMSLLSFAVGLFIVFNAVRFSLWYRRETFLNLRLMGVSVKTLAIAILLETLVWSFIGTGAGVFVGMQLGQLLLPGLSASLHSLYDASVGGVVELQWGSVVKSWLITLAGLFSALAWPLYRQLKGSVLVASATHTELDFESDARRHLVLGACLLMLVVVVLYPKLETVTAGFVLLGILLFAAAWMLPGLLALALALAARVLPERALFARWLVKDGWSQLPAFRAAMMALLLAMTANLGVGTLVDSFRHAFIQWLEARQSADIYIPGRQIDLQHLLDPETSRHWLADSHISNGVTSRWRDRQALVRGIDTHAPDSLKLPLAQWQGNGPDEALEIWRNQPDVVLANEQAHYLGGLQIGEYLKLPTDDGSHSYRVVGFFHDYGNPLFQFYLPRAEVEKRWQHAYSRGMALWLKPESSGAESHLQLAEQDLRHAGLQAGDWILQAEVRKLSVNIFERTFMISSAMNVLTLIVAAAALLVSLLAILQERLPQFAQWRALGVRQGEQLLVIVCPVLIFVSIAWLLAIPLGALLSWILIHKLNVVSFGWSMPMRWEMASAWELGILVMVVVVVAIGLTMHRTGRRLPEALAQSGGL